jgi:tetratricopeptide (TPR) repeat protein
MTHQRSMSCLDRQLDLVGDVIGGLDTVNSSTVAGIRERLEVLPDPGICDSRNIHARSCSYEPPSDPTITRVRKQIKNAQAAEIAGRTIQAGELAATAAAAARAAGTPTLVIDAHFTLGRVLAELGRPAPALDAMRTALRAAEAASCDPAAIDLDAAISKLVALNPSLDLGVGHLVNELGLARLDRVDEHDPGRKAQLLNDRGLLHEYRDEDYAAAERDYRAALQLRIESGLDDTTAQARSQQNLGNVLGKPDTTPRSCRRAASRRRRLPKQLR